MALNRQEVDELLSKEEICYIATSRPDGRPHVMPIWFIYHEGRIWFETDITTVKFKNIQHNNCVMIVFGGKSTYIVEGSVKWRKESELGFPIRKMYWEKYGEAMDDSYITEKTLLFELIPEKEQSWHYAPSWD